MKLLSVTTWLFTALFVANCSIDVSIDDISPNDFLKSSILATSRGVGDGQTDATVAILLKNSDGSLVTNYRPTFNFIDNNGSTASGSGITFSECSISSAEGISTCVIRSVLVGTRRILFNNISIDLVGDVFFDPPEHEGTFLQVVSSAQINVDASGYSVTSHTGNAFSGLKQEVNGYTIFINTTDSITPIE